MFEKLLSEIKCDTRSRQMRTLVVFLDLFLTLASEITLEERKEYYPSFQLPSGTRSQV